MGSPDTVLWSPRARERIRGLEAAERAAVRVASSAFRRSGTSPTDGPALSAHQGLRWHVVDDDVALEYAVYEPGELGVLPDGGFYVTLVITEASAVARVRKHLERTG